MTKVAILGCGPAGLLAAHATALAGYEPVIFSKKVKSKLPGAMYLHCSIEALAGEVADHPVLYVKEGNKQMYAAKVYGDRYAPCSWDIFETGFHRAWPMKDMYKRLWKMYSERIEDMLIDSVMLDDLPREFPLILSSIPAPVLCGYQESFHHFPAAKIWVKTKRGKGPNVIEYNGIPDVPWYRFSRLFGWESWEYGHEVADASTGVKPLNTNCDCRPLITRIGRFGHWKKGVLVHNAFEEAQNALLALQ